MLPTQLRDERRRLEPRPPESIISKCLKVALAVLLAIGVAGLITAFCLDHVNSNMWTHLGNHVDTYAAICGAAGAVALALSVALVRTVKRKEIEHIGKTDCDHVSRGSSLINHLGGTDSSFPGSHIDDDEASLVVDNS